MGSGDPAKVGTLIGGMMERRADGVYTARWGGAELKSAFQPIVEVSGEGFGVRAYEALTRPRRNGSPVSAEMFFANATRQEAGIIDPLCRALHFSNFAAFGPPDCSLLVNVEPAAHGDAALAESAAGLALSQAADCGLAPERIIFEIVERGGADERAIFAVAELFRAAGARVAVDDFGGQALDFARIAMLRPDIVKMDGGIVRQARSGGPHLKQLGRLCELARRFSIDLLIEGVETAADMRTCLQLKPRYLQGYNFGRPVRRPIAGEHYARRLARLSAGTARAAAENSAATA